MRRGAGKASGRADSLRNGARSMTMIQTEHLSYIYSAGTPFEKRAVDDISIEVQEGEFVGVIGHTQAPANPP